MEENLDNNDQPSDQFGNPETSNEDNKSNTSDNISGISENFENKSFKNLETTFDGNIENFIEKDENEKLTVEEKEKNQNNEIINSDSKVENDVDIQNVIDFEDLEVNEDTDNVLETEEREKQEMKLVNQKLAAEEGN